MIVKKKSGRLGIIVFFVLGMNEKGTRLFRPLKFEGAKDRSFTPDSNLIDQKKEIATLLHRHRH